MGHAASLVGLSTPHRHGATSEGESEMVCPFCSQFYQRLPFTDKFFRFCWRALVGLYIVRVYYQTQDFSLHVTWKMRRSTESSRILHISHNASHSKPQIIGHAVKRWIDYPAHSPLGIEGGVPQDTGRPKDHAQTTQPSDSQGFSEIPRRVLASDAQRSRPPTTPSRSETRGGLPPAPGWPRQRKY